MNRAVGVALSCLLSLIGGCDNVQECPDFQDRDFEDVDAKEAPDPYRSIASYRRDVEFDLADDEGAIELAGSFEVTGVQARFVVTCDSRRPDGYVVDAIAEFADDDGALAFEVPVSLSLSEDETSDPRLAVFSDLYLASEYPMTLPLTPEDGWKLAGIRTTHESDGPGEMRMLLEAWWVAAECENPNTCPTEDFEVVGSMPVDAFAFENAP